MGLIRLFLALSVVGDHTNSFPALKFVGGELAVQAFFLISGFYMALIVGSYETKKQFWFSRYLRLYPTYIVCALLTLFLVRGLHPYLGDLKQLPVTAIVFLTFTNLTIFFQDITMFLGVSGGDVFFTKNFTDSLPPLYTLLLVPQGWSLGLEISFYILAPYLLTRSTLFIFIVALSSIALRGLIVHYCCSADPWSYRFFPTELSIFLLGSLAFRWKILDQTKFTRLLIKLMYGSLLVILILFNYFPIEFVIKKIVFISLLAISIGGIFNLTKNWKIDYFLGMLSYPIYISHMFCLLYLIPKLRISAPNGDFFTTLLSYSVIIGFSVALYFLIEAPFDKIRHRFKAAKNSIKN